MMKLSIISPVYNEEVIVADFVKKAVWFIRSHKLNGEVIIVENGSKDKTLSILKNLKYKELRVLSLPVGNKGLALKKGLKEAKGEYLVTMDVDLWDEKFVLDSLENLKKYNVVVGSKSISGARDERSIISRLFNLGYNFCFRLIFNFQGTETHALLSFVRSKIIPLVNKCQTSELVFDTELILRAERAGLTKIEVPVIVKEIRTRRYSMVKQLVRTVQNSLKLGWVLGISPNWNYVLVFAALTLGAFMRFYNYHEWFFFSVDEEHYSYMSRMIVPDGHFPAIGGPISGTKLYMAPWFLYFNAFLFLLSGGNVVFSGIVFVLLELLTVIFIYLIGKKLFNPKIGAIAALLFAGSFFQAIADRHYWNITLVPIISAAAFYFLLNHKILITAIIVGLGLSTTFSVFAVFLFVLLALVLEKKFKDILKFLGIVAIFHFPLIIFDLRHNFWLLRGMGELFTTGKQSALSLGNTILVAIDTFAKSILIPVPVDVSDETSICPTGVERYQPGILAISTAFLAISLFVWRFKLVFLLFTVNFLSLFIFRGDQGSRHWLPSLPIFFILLAAFLDKLPGKKLIIAVLIFWNILSLTLSWASYGLKDKEKTVQEIINRTEAGKFYLDSVGECHKWGYRYLFTYFNHEPAASFLDPEFSWMFSKKLDPKAIKTYEIIKE